MEYTRERHPNRRADDPPESYADRWITYRAAIKWVWGLLFLLIPAAVWAVILWFTTIPPMQARLDNHTEQLTAMKVQYDSLNPKLRILVPAVLRIDSLLKKGER